MTTWRKELEIERAKQSDTYSDRLITVSVRKLPEGVWLVTSDDLPGLIVETDTAEEAIDLSRELAIDLI